MSKAITSGVATLRTAIHLLLTKFLCIWLTINVVSNLAVFSLTYYIEHFACVDFTEFLFLHYPFNQTVLSLALSDLSLTVFRSY